MSTQRRDSLVTTTRVDLGTVGLVHSAGPVHHSTPPSREDQHPSRPRIQGVPGQQRLDDKPNNCQTVSDELSNRSLCLPPHTSIDIISWRPDPEAQHSDAFTVNWKGLAGYAFPPFNLVPMVLNKVQSDQTEIVLIAPVWQAQPWWPLLLQLLVQQPVLLLNNKDLLQDPSDPFLIHPMYPRLHLGAFHISSDVTKQKAFLRTLPTYSSQQLVAPHAKPTNLAGSVGAAGVLQDKLILFQLL